MEEEEREWEIFVEETHLPQYSYILREIERIFQERKREVREKKLRKNLVLTKIYLPSREFSLLEELPAFKKHHSLGGIPTVRTEQEGIALEIELSDPRKRRTKAKTYRTTLSSREKG